MEMELEPRVRSLPYKIKAMSRESPTQKAAHVLDSDLRTHWSTGTNTKEWILLELEESCLLSHIRIYNKSVLEWEITAGLRFKPEAFVKVRPRCEAPRRDMIYPTNYTPCRYVRISCLRGNPISVFFIQLIGVSVSGLEPEFQPVVTYLQPHIISHKQDPHDMHLQINENVHVHVDCVMSMCTQQSAQTMNNAFALLQDITNRLVVFVPQLETDLSSFMDASESNIRFLAMLAGPFYPILQIVKEREVTKTLLSPPELDVSRSTQSSTLTVSSNFEVQSRRPSRSSSSFTQPASSSLAFRSDVVFLLLKKAYRDSHLGTVCRMASRALQKLVEPVTSQGDFSSDLTMPLSSDATAKTETLSNVHLIDYSSLFGEEFKISDDGWDETYVNLLDIAAVEEGIFHVLYACASQPLICCKLADSSSDFWSILPLVQALLPALRPPVNSSDQVDDSFSQWKHTSVQHALSQIVTMSSSSSIHSPLLRACAGYLSSFSPSHSKAACLLVDLCSGPFSPWISSVVLKVDLAIELMEDLLRIIQGAPHPRARAALKYIILALSGYMDDVLAKYKENKLKLLFLLEMLEPFLDPAITAVKNTIAFGDVSAIFLETQERNCAIALNIIRIAAQKPAVLPSLESEWRRGSVAPSVLLSVLEPHMPLPSDIDQCKCSVSKVIDLEPFTGSIGTSIHPHGALSKASSLGGADEKSDMSELPVKFDAFEETNLLFAPPELKKLVFTRSANNFLGNCPDKSSESSHGSTEGKGTVEKSCTNNIQLDNCFFVDFLNLQADYLQLLDHQDCETRASEFQRLALDLCSQHDITPEGHDAAIDALLLAAECYVNPFFMGSFRPTSKLINQINAIKSKMKKNGDVLALGRDFRKKKSDLEKVAHLEAKRDKTVLEILLQAAKLHKEYQSTISPGEPHPHDSDGKEEGLDINPLDLQYADAITLVRQNQALLCHFVMQQLQREQHSSHEILLQSLLILLSCATELFCPPENVIDIILQSADSLNKLFKSLYCQLKEGNVNFDMEQLHGVQRRWVLLQRLVIASSGSDDGIDFIRNRTNGFQYKCLVPPSSWMHKISKFSSNPYPLTRFLGWMAVSRHAKQYLKERSFLASDLSQLTSLLSIFSDELALIDKVTDTKTKASNTYMSATECHLELSNELGSYDRCSDQESFRVLYPDLHKFFPNMRTQFGSFGEVILEAVGLQLISLPCSCVPDILCWFSDLCMWPYSETGKCLQHATNSADRLKGYTAVNAKAIVLYLLESIVSEHMEAMVPEMPRIAQVLISLCRASYCDVAFLTSILCLLRPLISYFLGMVTDDKTQFIDELRSLDFESNFEELFDSIGCRKEDWNPTGDQSLQGSLMIFVLGALFPVLSFKRKRVILQSLLEWVDFTTTEPTSSFYNYLCAFQKVLGSFYILLIQNLNQYGISLPSKENESYENNIENHDLSLKSPRGFPESANHSSLTQPATDVDDLLNQGLHYFSMDEIKEFSEQLDILVSRLIPPIEFTWKLHYQLARKLTHTSAKCILFTRCLSSISGACSLAGNGVAESLCQFISSDLLSNCWRTALEGLIGVITTAQTNHCWQVASSMFDYLFSLPRDISLDCVICSACHVIKCFFLHAPRLSWRLQTDKWLTFLFMRGIGKLEGNKDSLDDLFCVMLCHSEPEVRSIALQHLGRIVGLESYEGLNKISHEVSRTSVGSDLAVSIPESIISAIVTNTWDRVAALALSDPSMLLKSHAMTLLSGYIPFAGRAQLQSLLVASNTIVRGTRKLSPPMEEGHVTRLSIGLLATACIYSPAEDIALIPESVWQKLEQIGKARTGILDDREKKLCEVLCRLETEAESAKKALKDALSSGTSSKQSNPNFQSTRETILQVLSSLASTQSYFDFFSRRADHDSQELEEAEIEIDLLQKEKAMQEVSENSRQETPMLSYISYDMKASRRLQKIKDDIQSLERSKLREEIAARRQKRLLMRRARQKYLEEAASREVELLQEIDRERTNELERSIERQKQLELERAKTRELQFNLEMERERQTQRDLQRELEQAESGVRSSRREFNSNPNSRQRERYRERDNVRPGHEGSLRPSSRGRESATSQIATSGSNAASPAPTVVLAGSRSFSGHLPTILQSRDRMEDRSTGYDDNFEGSRDSGDTNSVGDPELASSFDGLAGGFGSVPRHGSRGSKSRQMAERRERDGRREGKWERKNS